MPATHLDIRKPPSDSHLGFPGGSLAPSLGFVAARGRACVLRSTSGFDQPAPRAAPPTPAQGPVETAAPPARPLHHPHLRARHLATDLPRQVASPINRLRLSALATPRPAQRLRAPPPPATAVPRRPTPRPLPRPAPAAPPAG